MGLTKLTIVKEGKLGGKMLPDLMSLLLPLYYVHCIKAYPQKIGSELDINNVKAWIHPPVYLFSWWCSNNLGDAVALLEPTEHHLNATAF